METTVSILIPCHNASPWIEEALRSALDQSWPQCEVRVIDDGSTDASPALLADWEDRVEVVRRGNRGGNPTRNELLQQARGEWVQFLDADDALLPGKITAQMAVTAAHPEADVIYSPVLTEHHGTAGVLRQERWPRHDPAGDHDPWAYHLGWQLTQTGGALFRREKLLEIGGWNEAQTCCQDNELFFRLLQAGARFVHCPEAGAIYRRFEDGSVSTRNQSRVRDEILRLLEAGERHLEATGGLTPRRRDALNNNRLGLARRLWPDDRAAARAVMRTLRASDPHFQPAAGAQAPRLYRWCFRAVGFDWAERISAAKRALLAR